MKGLGYVDIGTRYKSGSTINWMRNEIRSLEEGVTLIIQTGINNILNTKQSNANIIHQYRQLLKENKNKNIIMSSIIPASDRKGELYSRVFEINEELRRMAEQEQVTVMNKIKEKSRKHRIIYIFKLDNISVEKCLYLYQTFLCSSIHF